MTTPSHRHVPRKLALLVTVLAVAGLTAGLAVAASKSDDRSPNAAPVSAAPPTINGTLTQGATLSGDPGRFATDAPPLTFFYQWFRCNTSGGACAPIGGATQASYVLQPGDVGQTVLLQITAVDSEGTPSAAVNSATSGVVQPAEDPEVAPDNIVAPRIAGQTV
jgi:hypothetical protein